MKSIFLLPNGLSKDVSKKTKGTKANVICYKAKQE